MNFEQQMRRATKLAKNGSMIIVPRFKSECIEMLVKDPCYSANFFEDAPSGYWTTASDAAAMGGETPVHDFSKWATGWPQPMSNQQIVDHFKKMAASLPKAMEEACEKIEKGFYSPSVDWPVESLKHDPAEFDRTWGKLFSERWLDSMYGVPARMLKNEKES